MALPLFAITLFVSAFLLFLVQPMIGKMILPKLGGTPQVWNTCMLFFQTALLAGYGYTHSISTKLPLRRQLIIHCVLLALPLLFLLPRGPFNVEDWAPPAGSNPIWSTLLLLAIVVGVPFFVVSTSAPLLQKWFASTGHPAAQDPYFLYGASNLGSLLSLVAYPFLVEPNIPLVPQAWVWTISYVILGGLVLACTALVWKSLPMVQLTGLTPAPDVPPVGDVPPQDLPPQDLPPQPSPAPETGVKAGPAPSAPRSTGITRKKHFKGPGKMPAPEASHVPAGPSYLQPSTEAVTNWRRLRWVALAFAPSSLMLGVTSYISVDLSPFPLLWVIPLALYLITFILVFSKWPTPWTEVPHTIVLFLAPIALLLLAYILSSKTGFDAFVTTFLCFVGFFGAALVCHGELARDRPTPKHLTEFFLWMSVGGMLGGLFNALIAPLIFWGVVEFPIAIIVACLLLPKLKENGWFDELLLNAFPGLQTKVRDTGDRLAVASGKSAPHSNWVLNYSLDIFFGLFMFGLALFLTNYAEKNEWFDGYGMVKILKFFGLDDKPEADGRPGAAIRWAGKAANLVVLGIPMVLCFFFASRPLRFGLAVAALLYVHLVIQARDRNIIYAARSYFGVLRVVESRENLYLRTTKDERVFSDPEIPPPKDNKGQPVPLATFTHLLHGTTDHGRNYHFPTELRRLATTYYHRKGPVGVIMERYNWGSMVKKKELEGGKEVEVLENVAKQNTFYADNRLPASMVGLGATAIGIGNLPLEQLNTVWSEPPYATIGLGTGTMASYGRPFQHVVYYEIDENVRNFSLPPQPISSRFLFKDDDLPFFTYLTDAVQRGANLEVIMGDARQSMKNERPGDTALYSMPKEKADFYVKNLVEHPAFSKRDNYYKVIVVDAFSSDAIPLHLITKEAVELYFSKLAPDGVLCMHTSNRHMDLVSPLADIAKALKKPYRRGHDVGSRNAPHPFLGHYGSEYVMLANDEKYLPKVGTITLSRTHEQQWDTPRPPGRAVWTDDFSNIVSILR